MKKNERSWAFLAACLCVGAVLLTGYYYVTSLHTDMMKQAINNILMMTRQREQSFSCFVDMDRERIHSFASYFNACSSTDDSTLLSRMKAFDEVEAFYSVVNKETGTYYNNKAATPQRMSPEDLESYRELSGSGIRKNYVSPYTGSPMFGYYECFRFADGVEGVFQKGYDSSKISREFSLSFYNDQGFAFVVTRSGDVLLRSVGSEEGYTFDNIFQSIDASQKNKELRVSFINAMGANESGVKVFDNEGRDYVYTYVPVSEVEDWYMISIVPLDVIMTEADEIINNSRVMFFLVFIALIILAVVIFLMWQIHRNIERKDQEIAYREQKFDVLIAFLARNTDDVYIMMNKDDFRVKHVSPNVERVLGIPEREARASIRSLRRAIYKSKDKISFEDLQMMTVGQTIGPMEAERINPQTKERKWYRETLYDVQIQDKEMIVVYISDRTDEQRIQDTLTESLEAVQVANKAKTTFLSSMSHDIRTPMNAIMGLITLIQEDADDPERVREYAHRMDGASHHLLELINNVLDMNKIESGSATLSIGELNMAELIDNINTIIRPQAKAKGQEFKLWATPLTSEHLLGDGTRISQILINLLSNSVKYTQDGGTIQFTVRELPQLLNNYCRIQFVIQDNGRGMSEEYQKVMFNPFTREQNTFTNKIQGTGLGMAITKSLVDLMGGTIQVESKLGEGTTFTVELELRIQNKPVDDGNFWRDHGITRMIVADDDPEARTNVVHAMRDTGVEVHYAEDGEEAVRMIRESRERGEPYDLILLDWRMPKLNGLETARLIRKNYPQKIPILFFTAYDWSDIEEEAKEIGVSHFLPKPFFMTTFQEAIRRMMTSREAEAAAPAQKPVSILEGKNILVAEDIEVNRLILSKILGARGATCVMAANGQEAVDKFNASRPGEFDMIFMDVQMPLLNGYEATRAIRAGSHPCAKSVLIIAMTANAFADDVRDALESGMNAHVSKPIIMDQLESTIIRLLEERRDGKGQ